MGQNVAEIDQHDKTVVVDAVHMSQEMVTMTAVGNFVKMLLEAVVAGALVIAWGNGMYEMAATLGMLGRFVTGMEEMDVIHEMAKNPGVVEAIVIGIGGTGTGIGIRRVGTRKVEGVVGSSGIVKVVMLGVIGRTAVLSTGILLLIPPNLDIHSMIGLVVETPCTDPMPDTLPAGVMEASTLMDIMQCTHMKLPHLKPQYQAVAAVQLKSRLHLLYQL